VTTRAMGPGAVLRWGWLSVVAAVVVLPVVVTVVTAADPANVRAALDAIPLGHQYQVSVAVTALQTAAQLATSGLAAYALVFPHWRGRTVAFGLVLVTLAIPGESSVIPNFELVSALGLRDTLLGITVPFLAAGYPVFLLRQAFSGLDREVWEASRLDGCGHLRSLVSVVAPMARPQLATAALWCALAAWNGYFWPLLITDSPPRRTVQVGLAQLAASESTTPAVIYAGTLLVLLPTLLLVVAGQRYLVRGLASRFSV
jgi:ABC-type glycerol-3-phosphate transport system permease component